ncbi:MAG: VOC family protein [Burkholderiaceae bacterium]
MLKPPFVIAQIDHVVLRVAGLARSEAFYASVLGCVVVKRRDELGLVHLRAGSSMIDLISINGKLGAMGGEAAGVQGRNVDHLCLRVDAFDEQAIVAHLALLGVQSRAPASVNFGAEGEGPSLYFQDVDGNTIELKGPSAPAPVDA